MRKTRDTLNYILNAWEEDIDNFTLRQSEFTVELFTKKRQYHEELDQKEQSWREEQPQSSTSIRVWGLWLNRELTNQIHLMFTQST